MADIKEMLRVEYLTRKAQDGWTMTRCAAHFGVVELTFRNWLKPGGTTPETSRAGELASFLRIPKPMILHILEPGAVSYEEAELWAAASNGGPPKANGRPGTAARNSSTSRKKKQGKFDYRTTRPEPNRVSVPPAA